MLGHVTLLSCYYVQPNDHACPHRCTWLCYSTTPFPISPHHLALQVFTLTPWLPPHHTLLQMTHHVAFSKQRSRWRRFRVLRGRGRQGSCGGHEPEGPLISPTLTSRRRHIEGRQRLRASTVYGTALLNSGAAALTFVEGNAEACNFPTGR